MIGVIVNVMVVIIVMIIVMIQVNQNQRKFSTFEAKQKKENNGVREVLDSPLIDPEEVCGCATSTLV